MANIRFKKINNRKWLEGQMQTKSLHQIAEEIGCSYSAVVYQVRKHGLEVPERFTRRKSPTRSENVKKALAERYPEGRFGELHPRWAGGRHKQKTGYVVVYAPNHPRAGRARRVFEHILVAEKTLGRYLNDDEIVHHINGNKSDNRPENLEVITRSVHFHNHYTDGDNIQKLVKRIEYLEGLLDEHKIKYNK